MAHSPPTAAATCCHTCSLESEHAELNDKFESKAAYQQSAAELQMGRLREEHKVNLKETREEHATILKETVEQHETFYSALNAMHEVRPRSGWRHHSTSLLIVPPLSIPAPNLTRPNTMLR